MSPKIWVPIVIVLTILLLCAGGGIWAIFQWQNAAGEAIARNQLMQCALGTHSYHDTYRKFPNAYSMGGMYQQPKSAWFHLLPYIEADNVYKLNNERAVVRVFLSP